MEKSRRFAELRPVCVDLNTLHRVLQLPWLYN